MPKSKKENKIHNRLDIILKEKNITADELAKKTGITAATISRFKNFKTNLSMENIFDITKALDINLGELFGETLVNYKDLVNVKFIPNINLFNCYEELENKNNFLNFAISSFLLNELGIKKVINLIITNINNNSMYSTISPTDYLIIDLNEKTIERDGLYLVNEQGQFEIRRVRINEDNNLEISVDNKRFIGGYSKIYDRKNNIIHGKVLKIIKNDI